MGGSRRLAFLVTSLILFMMGAALLTFLSYADEHKYEPAFDWVSGASMQTLAFMMLIIFVFALLFAIAGVREKPNE
jgi:succinate dehydrogenase hydrophobic anchor subunit